MSVHQRLRFATVAAAAAVALAAGAAIAIVPGCELSSVMTGGATQPMDRPADLYAAADGLVDVQPNGGGITLARGVVIEDDGPAFGIFDQAAEVAQPQGGQAAQLALRLTDTPCWEPLSATRRIRKILPIAPLNPKSAELLVFASRAGRAPLHVQVNGAPVVFDPPDGASSQPDCRACASRSAGAISR